MGVVVAIAAAQRAQRASQGQALKKQQTLAKHLSQDIQVAPKSGPSFHQTFSPARSPAHTRMPPMNTSVVFTDEHPGDEPFHKLYLLKVFMKKLYTSRASEVTFAALIMGNFVANAAEAQVAAGDTADNIFNVFEIFFGAAFTFELVLNMIGHWWREFWRSAWNWFDALVVVVSILNVSGGGLPGLGTLRILRAFRVVRLFKRAGSLKKIILAIGEALPGVMNAFAILMMVMCLYAILAVDLFGAQEENKQMFGKFSTALFTMFQMMTTEGWADIARDVMATSGDGYAVFFVSFILIANILLANVVIAVLIEKVIAFQDDESDSGDPDMMADFPHIPAHFWNGNEAENIDLSSAASTDSSLVPNNSMPHRTVNTMSKRQYSVKDSLRDLENEEDVRGGRIHVPALDDTGLRPNYSKEQQSFNEGLSTNTDLEHNRSRDSVKSVASEVERNLSTDKTSLGRRGSSGGLTGAISRRESILITTNNIAMMTAPLQAMAASMAKQNKDKGKGTGKNRRGSIDVKKEEQMKRFASVASAVESAKINDKLDLIITLLQEHLQNSEEMEMMSYMKDSRNERLDSGINSRNESPKHTWSAETPKRANAERMKVNAAAHLEPKRINTERMRESSYMTTSSKLLHLRQEEQTDTMSRRSSSDHSENSESLRARLSIKIPLPLPLSGSPPGSARESEGSDSRVSIDLQTQRSPAGEDAYMVTEAEIKAVQDTPIKAV